MPIIRRVVRSPEKKKTWMPLIKTGLFALGVLLTVGFFSFMVFATWVSRDLPDPNSLASREIPQSTKIFDRTGTHLLYEIHGDEKRTLIKIQDIPKIMQQATIAIEDRGFYEHHGIYWRGLIRAVFMSVIKVQRVQGTSTLTQQLVKNAVLTNQRSLLRKLKEFILALQIERRYSKEEILQMYLNEIPYGSTLYGVESASQSYFGKSAKDLTLDEAALLAAVPQAPDFYSPYGTGSHGDNRPRLVGRQQHVLSLMAEQGFITAEQSREAKAVDTLKKLKPKRVGDIQAPHFVTYVRSLLTDKYGQKKVEQGGLKVTTTLDWDKEQVAEEEVLKGVEARGKAYHFTNAALVSIDPKTGQILAMVGSKDFFDTEHDGQVNVTLRPRQPGSSFKPIVYAAGFIKGYLPTTQLWDVETTFKTDIGPYTPHDYDGKERGPVAIRQALQGSLNIPAVEMLYLVGVGRALDFAESLGYTTFAERSRFGLALVLGGAEVKPLEHAAAFGTFATEGVLYPSSAILKVEEPDGTSLEEWKPSPGARVMEPQIARLVSNVLSDNDARAFIFGAHNALTLPDRPVAAKTGTTSNYHDAWTVGYTPSLVAAVWVGNNDNKEMKKGADGSVIAAPIWQAYMRRATRGTPVESFVPPAPPTTDKPVLLGGAVQHSVKIDRISGKRATENTPPELIEERIMYETHSILYYLDKDDPLGPPPTNPASDPQFENWEAAVQAWAQRAQWHTTSTIPVELDDVHTPANQPQVTILQPTMSQTIPERTLFLNLDVRAPRSLSRVEVTMDGLPLGSHASPPWNFDLHIPNMIGKGPHEVGVTVFDDVGNRGRAAVTIDLTAEPETVQIFSTSTGG